jgi:hypothetical protein
VAIAILGRQSEQNPFLFKLGSFPKNRKQHFYLCMILRIYVLLLGENKGEVRKDVNYGGYHKVPTNISMCLPYPSISAILSFGFLLKKKDVLLRNY